MDRKLRAFLRIAETANLTEAAHLLNVAQPSLSKTLQKLEHEVGDILFERHKRGMRLTPSGERFLERAKNIEREYRLGREEVEAVKKGFMPVLRVGAGALYHMAYVPSVFQTIIKAVPETRLELNAGGNNLTIPLLINGDLDLVLGKLETEKPEAGFQMKRLVTVETGLVMRADHPIRRSGDVRPESLRKYPWMIYQPDPDSLERVASYFRNHGLTAPRMAVLSNSFTTLLRLAADDDYILTAPVQLRHVVEAAGLKVLKLPEPIVRFESGVHYHAASLRYPVVNLFIKTLEDVIGKLNR